MAGLDRLLICRPCSDWISELVEQRCEIDGRPGRVIGMPGVDRALVCGACFLIVALPGENDAEGAGACRARLRVPAAVRLFVSGRRSLEVAVLFEQVAEVECRKRSDVRI